MSNIVERTWCYSGFIQGWRAVAIACLLSTQILFLSAQPAQAKSSERIIENPPQLDLRQESIPPILLTPSSVAPAAAGAQAEKTFDLNIEYTDGQLYNPATQRYDQVHLRSYVGTDTSPERPYEIGRAHVWTPVTL